MLPEIVVGALRAHRTRQRMERPVAGSRWVDSGHVFTTSIGTPIKAAAVTRRFHTALDAAGLPRSRFHDLRHAAATFLLGQGMTLEDVKQLLGHTSIVLTSNTYAHVLEQRQRQVAGAMDAVLSGWALCVGQGDATYLWAIGPHAKPPAPLVVGQFEPTAIAAPPCPWNDPRSTSYRVAKRPEEMRQVMPLYAGLGRYRPSRRRVSLRFGRSGP